MSKPDRRVFGPAHREPLTPAQYEELVAVRNELAQLEFAALPRDVQRTMESFIDVVDGLHDRVEA